MLPAGKHRAGIRSRTPPRAALVHLDVEIHRVTRYGDHLRRHRTHVIADERRCGRSIVLSGDPTGACLGNRSSHSRQRPGQGAADSPGAFKIFHAKKWCRCRARRNRRPLASGRPGVPSRAHASKQLREASGHVHASCAHRNAGPGPGARVHFPSGGTRPPFFVVGGRTPGPLVLSAHAAPCAASSTPTLSA